MISLLVAGFGYGGYSLLTMRDNVIRLGEIGEEARLAKELESEMVGMRIAVRNFAFTGDQKLPPVVRNLHTALLGRIAATKKAVEDPTRLRLVTDIEALAAEYLVSFEKLVELRTRQDSMVRERMDLLADSVFRHFTEIKEKSAAAGALTASFAAGKRRNIGSWLGWWWTGSLSAGTPRHGGSSTRTSAKCESIWKSSMPC